MICTAGGGLPPWESIPGSGLLLGWAAELKAAIAKADEHEWRDVGRAVILVVDNFARAETAARQVATEAGMSFLSIDAEDVLDLAPRSTFRKQAPALLYLEPGDWLQSRQEDDTEEWADKKLDFQKRLVKWIGEFESAKPIVLVTANYALGDMSGIIDGPGLFDRYFVLPPVPLAQVGEDFMTDLGRDLCGETMTASSLKLGKFVADGYSNGKRREMAILYLRRLHKREQRPIEFLDLMHLATHGFGEEANVEAESDEVRRQVAMHEAGHAAMAILDSGGRNTPDYCSIVPGVDFKGIVADSISYHQSLGDRMTYADFRHQIRTSLAGRAAEELGYGPENVSQGAAGDLENAWRLSYSAFSSWGFAPQMETAAASASNLAVVVDKPTASEVAHVESLIRGFLTEEYQHVLQQLSAQRVFMEAIAARLMWDPIVDQSELVELAAKNGITVQL